MEMFNAKGVTFSSDGDSKMNSDPSNCESFNPVRLARHVQQLRVVAATRHPQDAHATCPQFVSTVADFSSKQMGHSLSLRAAKDPLIFSSE
jgi:hypothetical protein